MKRFLTLLAALTLMGCLFGCAKEPEIPTGTFTIGESGKGETVAVEPVSSRWRSGSEEYTAEAPDILSAEAVRTALSVKTDDDVYISFGDMKASIVQCRRFDADAEEGAAPFTSVGIGGFIPVPKKAQDYIFEINAYFGENDENRVTFYIEIRRP